MNSSLLFLHGKYFKRKFYGGGVARSRLLLSPMVPYGQKNLPNTPRSTALTLDLTLYNLRRGTKLVACLSNKRDHEHNKMDRTYEHMMQQARYEKCKS